MIKNVWKHTQFYCGCRMHESPIPLISIAHGEMSVYSDFICPKHDPESAENPEGYAPGDTPCTTALSFPEADEVIKRLTALMEEDAFLASDYTGATFVTKHGVGARIKKYSYKDIDLLLWREEGR